MTASLHNAFPLVLHGGDILLRILLFWSLFLPCGEVSMISSEPTCKTNSTNKTFDLFEWILFCICQVFVKFIKYVKHYPFCSCHFAMK
jgi:hypothetical protein